MRLNSIRTRTLMVLILICVAIVFIMGGLWLNTTSQNIKKAVLTTDLHDSELIANYVHMYVESLEASEKLASNDSEIIKALDENNVSRARGVLDHLVAATPQDDIAFVVGRDGRILYHTCRMPDRPQPPEPPAIIKLRKNATYVTGVFYSNEFRDHVFAVVSPVRENGSNIGYIYDEVRPADLYSFLIKARGDFIHQMTLVDGGGKVILDNNRSLMEQHANLSLYLPVKKVLMGEKGVVEHTGLYECQPCISAYYPIPDTGWGLIISTQADVAYRPLQGHALRILGVSALFIVALTVFGCFASTYLIYPIERLSRTMRKVSGGDYSVSIKSTRNDEIGDLERVFNSLVTEIKKWDERIRTERDHSEFYLDLMSHDINNMNHAGMGYLELAIDNLKGRIRDDDMALIAKAYESLKNSSSLIDNVRKIQKAQMSFLTPEVLDLGQLLAEVKEKYARYPGRDITINYAPASCLIRACGLFKEALSNIVENAIKHSDPARPLIINMALARVKEGYRDYCRVSIEDNGPGILDEIKEAIFTRFQRGCTGAGGKGLGLYIVKMLVEGFGGKVWVEDRVQGDHTKGARFVILMPAA